MSRVALIALGLSFGLAACNDPNNPQTWIKRLRDPEYATQAIKELQRIGDPAAVPPLCELYKDFESPTILKAIISFKDKRAIPTLIAALEFTEDKYHNATLAAATLAEMKATEAVEPLTKVLDKAISIRSRANLAKLAAIEALAQLGDKRAVGALIKTLERRPEQQDFLLNKKAAEALGELGDPQAVPVLIRALFTSSTLQGTSFPMARVALVRIGQPAVKPLLEAMQGKDRALEGMAKELKFADGVVLNKTAIVLGDLGAKDAVPALLEQLGKASPTETKVAGVIEGLGKIGDERAVEPLVKLLLNGKVDYKIRQQAAQALTVLGSKKAIAPLLEVAEKGYVEGGYSNLREACAMAYSRIVGKEAGQGVAKIKAMIADDKIKGDPRVVGTFKEALERVQVALECQDDAACYGKKVTDEKLSLAQREKAGIMIGILPDGRKALADLVKALPVREPILRLFFLQSAMRIGNGKDTQLIAMLEELAAKDSKRPVKFLGADLATHDKMAVALIKKK
ncbi:MAG: HEAT repeat domain-containing protein [Deltaproteobacteria bacterium]|nr:HEAT repeat domain-containing protein [Deltaproteobacteria bacterium]